MMILNKVLVVIDMQNDFIDGSLGNAEAQAIVPKVNEKIKNFNGDIYYTKDTHYEASYLKTIEGQKLPILHCEMFTHGWEITDKIIIHRKYNIVTKETFGSLQLPELIKAEYPDVNEIHIVGLCTDICVITNALILKTYFKNAKIIVDASCCAGTTPENHQKALDVMKCCHIDVINE